MSKFFFVAALAAVLAGCASQPAQPTLPPGAEVYVGTLGKSTPSYPCKGEGMPIEMGVLGGAVYYGGADAGIDQAGSFHLEVGTTHLNGRVKQGQIRGQFVDRGCRSSFVLAKTEEAAAR